MMSCINIWRLNVPYDHVLASTYGAVRSVNGVLDPVDKRSLQGAQGVSGYAKNHENRRQKCHENRST